MITSLLVIYGIVLNLQIATLVTMMSALKRLPENYRSMKPGAVLLNLIPLFNFGWIFTSVFAISKSYKKYTFDKQIGFSNANLGLGIAYGILTILVYIPFFNYLVLLFWGVVLVIYNLSISNCKKIMYRHT